MSKRENQFKAKLRNKAQAFVLKLLEPVYEEIKAQREHVDQLEKEFRHEVHDFDDVDSAVSEAVDNTIEGAIENYFAYGSSSVIEDAVDNAIQNLQFDADVDISVR